MVFGATLFSKFLATRIHWLFPSKYSRMDITFKALKKLVFLDFVEGVATVWRLCWSGATGDYANVVQAVPNMIEIMPHGTSKGNGIELLLDLLGATLNEIIMAIGDWENIEMLELVALAVALGNWLEM